MLTIVHLPIYIYAEHRIGKDFVSTRIKRCCFFLKYYMFCSILVWRFYFFEFIRIHMKEFQTNHYFFKKRQLIKFFNVKRFYPFLFLWYELRYIIFYERWKRCWCWWDFQVGQFLNIFLLAFSMILQQQHFKLLILILSSCW